MIFDLFTHILSSLHPHIVQSYHDELYAVSSLYILSDHYIVALLEGVYLLCNGRVEQNMVKNRSIMSNSVSQGCLKISPIRG